MWPKQKTNKKMVRGGRDQFGVVFLVRRKLEFMILVTDGIKRCETKGRVGFFPEVLSMTDSRSRCT